MGIYFPVLLNDAAPGKPFIDLRNRQIKNYSLLQVAYMNLYNGASIFFGAVSPNRLVSRFSLLLINIMHFCGR